MSRQSAENDAAVTGRYAAKFWHGQDVRVTYHHGRYDKQAQESTALGTVLAADRPDHLVLTVGGVRTSIHVSRVRAVTRVIPPGEGNTNSE